MSTTKKDYQNNCFSPNWIDVGLSETEESVNMEVRLESKRRKDLNTLLKELDEIKLNILKIAEKQQKLADLMRFYTEDYAQ